MKINNNLQTQYTQAKKQPVEKESDGMPKDAVTLGSTEQQGEAKELKKWTFMHYALQNLWAPYLFFHLKTSGNLLRLQVT